MGDHVFEISDKSGRKIRLTKRQWIHISRKHPAVANYQDEIKETIKSPDAVTDSDEENVYFYYRHYKYLKAPYSYVLVMIKHLNGEGFVITAYFEKNIK